MSEVIVAPTAIVLTVPLPPKVNETGVPVPVVSMSVTVAVVIATLPVLTAIARS